MKEVVDDRRVIVKGLNNVDHIPSSVEPIRDARSIEQSGAMLLSPHR